MNSKFLRIFLALVIPLAVTLIACAANSTSGSGSFGDAIKCEDRTSHIAYSGDVTFTEAERADWETASRNVASFSNGRMGATYEWRGVHKPGELHLHRVFSTDQIVLDEDTKVAKAFNLPEFFHAGWSENSQIYIVVDRITREHFLPVITHELVHALGVRWPGCPKEKGEDCYHTDDPTALMCGVPRATKCGPENNTLGPGDLVFCRASCLCD